MTARYSIAEARNHFAKLVHAAEQGARVEVTRRGTPVAVLLSLDEFKRLAPPRPSFSAAAKAFREHRSAEELGELHSALSGVRDRSSGRTVEL